MDVQVGFTSLLVGSGKVLLNLLQPLDLRLQLLSTPSCSDTPLNLWLSVRLFSTCRSCLVSQLVEVLAKEREVAQHVRLNILDKLLLLTFPKSYPECVSL